MGIEGTDIGEVTVLDIDGEPVRLGDRAPRYLVLQVLRYYG
ncbi:MAG: hypothetical protein AAGK32_15835 [Actinomycetota bacterium]